MSKAAGMIAIIDALLCCGPAEAFNLKGRIAISPSLAVAYPIGDAADDNPGNIQAFGMAPGYSGSGAIEYGLSRTISLGGRFRFARLGFHEEAYSPGAFVDDVEGHWTVTEFIGVYLKSTPDMERSVGPYVWGGPVFAGARLNLDFRDDGYESRGTIELSDSWGVDAGIGVLRMFSDNTGGFLELGITHLRTDGGDAKINVNGPTYYSETHGNLTWLSLRVGLTVFTGP